MKRSSKKILALVLSVFMILMSVVPVFAGEFENVQVTTITEKNFTLEGGMGKAKFKCVSLTEKNGILYGTFEGFSASMTHIYVGDMSTTKGEVLTKYNPETGFIGENVYEIKDKKVEIPVMVNAKSKIAVRSTAMSKTNWIGYTYEIKLSQEQETEPSMYLVEENNTGMFKVTDAYMQKVGGKDFIYITLSGQGYHYLYKGMYKDALATGNDYSKWIKGVQRTDSLDLEYPALRGNKKVLEPKNSKGLWQFAIPVEDDEEYIPIQALSESNKKWFPRYLDIDRKQNTIRSGDFSGSSNLTIENKSELVEVAGGELKTVGGPNSNNYRVHANLIMPDDKYDSLSVNFDVNNQKYILKKGAFDIDVERNIGFGKQMRTASIDNKPTMAYFHDAKTNKNIEVIFNFDAEQSKLTIEDKPEETFRRLEGDNRYLTAYKIADELLKNQNKNKFDAAVIACGTEYADALSSSYFAAKIQAPVLLTSKYEASNTVNYVKSKVKPGSKVYIAGGVDVVPQSVENGLKSAGYRLIRFAGKNRYDTNLMILKEANVEAEDILICSGNGYADAISASAAGKPIMLVNEYLYDVQKKFLSGLKTKKLYIIGGADVVNEKIKKSVSTYAGVERVAGDNRYDTSLRIAEKFFGNPKQIIIAYGDDFADGLSASSIASYNKVPILLANNRNIIYPKNYVSNKKIYNLIITGGTDLISDIAAKSVLK